MRKKRGRERSVTVEDMEHYFPVLPIINPYLDMRENKMFYVVMNDLRETLRSNILASQFLNEIDSMVAAIESKPEDDKVFMRIAFLTAMCLGLYSGQHRGILAVGRAEGRIQSKRGKASAAMRQTIAEQTWKPHLRELAEEVLAQTPDLSTSKVAEIALEGWRLTIPRPGDKSARTEIAKMRREVSR